MKGGKYVWSLNLRSYVHTSFYLKNLKNRAQHYLLFCMGVKFCFSLWGMGTGEEWINSDCWEEYL